MDILLISTNTRFLTVIIVFDKKIFYDFYNKLIRSIKIVYPYFIYDWKLKKL